MRFASKLGFRSREVPLVWARGEGEREPAPRNAIESRLRLAQRAKAYPGMRELTGTWDGHDDQVCLVYGCGAGEDALGVLLHSEPRLVIGADADLEALAATRERLSLHRDARWRCIVWELDRSPEIPCREERIDFVACDGGLKRASDPLRILREVHRLLVPGGQASVTVPSRDSVWAHLRVAYERQARDGAHAGLTLEEAYAADVGAFPIERLWRPRDFLKLARKAGLHGGFVGGYFSQPELACLKRSLRDALSCPTLAEDSRRFLSGLAFDAHGLPLHEGSYAGLGGTFRLRKG